FVWDSAIVDVLGDTKVSGVRLRNLLTKEESELDVAGGFVVIGHHPNTDVFKGHLAMAEAGSLLTHDGSRTDVEGVFACGDVQDHVYRQAITAAGSGWMAALDAGHYLEAIPPPPTTSKPS